VDKQIKKLKKDKIVAETMILAGILTLAVTLLITLLIDPRPILIALAVGGFLLVFFGYSNYAHLKETFKKDFLNNLIEEWIERGTHEPEHGLSEHQVHETGFLEKPDVFTSWDFLFGAMAGVPFISSDIRLEKETEKKRHTTKTNTYFLGRVFSFEFNRIFDGTIFILSENRPNDGKEYKEATPEFGHLAVNFDVLTTKKTLARNMFTKDFMRILEKLQSNHPAKAELAFTGSKCHVAINNLEDAFKLRMLRPINADLMQIFKEDIAILHELINLLKDKNPVFKGA